MNRILTPQADREKARAEQAARRAEALRANLKRRKAQQRARDAGAETPSATRENQP